MASEPFDHKGVDLVHPQNRLASGKTTISQNIRNYVAGGITFRNFLTGALYTLAAAAHSLHRINDSTPNGPPSGFSIVNGASTVLSIWNSTIGVKTVATGLSGNPVSMIPFRPNISVQPWMYVGDSAPAGNVTIYTQYLVTTGPNATDGVGNLVNFVTNGFTKTRSDGKIYKGGIKEPQLAPTLATGNSTITGTGNLAATTLPWTISQEASFDYGQTNAGDGTAPYIINVLNATSVTISATGTATVNGNASATPATPSGNTSGYPGAFVQNPAPSGAVPGTADVVIGVFVEADGITLVPHAATPFKAVDAVNIGAGVTLTVPANASTLQIGIDSLANTFNSNSGSFTLNYTVEIEGIANVLSILGDVTTYYWGDSNHSSNVGDYIWKNPSDTGGSGPVRTISNAGLAGPGGTNVSPGFTTGNSFIFDATITGGQAVPDENGVGSPSVPMTWSQLGTDGSITGSVSVFTPALETEGYSDFNLCVVSTIFVPVTGDYTFTVTSHDNTMWGIEGATLTSSPATVSTQGQTITVVNGYPLLPECRGNNMSGGGSYIQVTVHLLAGTPGIEMDYDYWDKSGRVLLLTGSPTPGAPPATIVPLPANVRQNVQYRYVYRSSATGAESNPSPESVEQTVPVISNTITSFWSPDPQVDVVDYYRIDANVGEFTYVATGPNDNGLGGGLNTPITDALTDTELGSLLLEYDNYEPFPSIDLPQKGVCTVSGGVITWISGGAIGGSSTGFNIRWLAGTEILIGWPTSLPYTFIARPTAVAFAINTAYSLNWIVLDPAKHYQLVTVAGTSGATVPTFNDVGGTTVSGGVTFTDKGTQAPTGYVLQVTIPGVPDGSNLAYEIPSPILAAQPLPYLWGPTDNINFCYGVGDPLRPGTLYWCKGSNLDAAPDTNQTDVTDPSEPLVNGALSGGLGVLFSIKRGWLILPNFATATATAQGVTGTAWTLQESSITRGLYMPRCVCVSGGGLIFFRVSDGIHVSPLGASSISITDQDLYTLFPHEDADSGTSVPQPVTRNGVTIYPPDDSQPQAQRFSTQGQLMYYDYLDTSSIPRTLVYDIENHGWIWDIYTPPATIHATNEGQSQQGVLVGCNDGTVRQLASAGLEVITGIVQSGAIGGRGYVHVGMIELEYSSNSTVTLNCYAVDEGNGSYGPPTITLPSTGGVLTKYFLRPGANKWKLLVAQFSSTTSFVLNFQGTCFYCRSWGDTSEYKPVTIFGSEGGEG